MNFFYGAFLIPNQFSRNDLWQVLLYAFVRFFFVKEFYKKDGISFSFLFTKRKYNRPDNSNHHFRCFTKILNVDCLLSHSIFCLTNSIVIDWNCRVCILFNNWIINTFYKTAPVNNFCTYKIIEYDLRYYQKDKYFQ